MLAIRCPSAHRDNIKELDAIHRSLQVKLREIENTPPLLHYSEPKSTHSDIPTSYSNVPTPREQCVDVKVSVGMQERVPLNNDPILNRGRTGHHDCVVGEFPSHTVVSRVPPVQIQTSSPQKTDMSAKVVNRNQSTSSRDNIECTLHDKSIQHTGSEHTESRHSGSACIGSEDPGNEHTGSEYSQFSQQLQYKESEIDFPHDISSSLTRTDRDMSVSRRKSLDGSSIYSLTDISLTEDESDHSPGGRAAKEDVSWTSGGEVLGTDMDETLGGEVSNEGGNHTPIGCVPVEGTKETPGEVLSHGDNKGEAVSEPCGKGDSVSATLSPSISVSHHNILADQQIVDTNLHKHAKTSPLSLESPAPPVTCHSLPTNTRASDTTIPQVTLSDVSRSSRVLQEPLSPATSSHARSATNSRDDLVSTTIGSSDSKSNVGKAENKDRASQDPKIHRLPNFFMPPEELEVSMRRLRASALTRPPPRLWQGVEKENKMLLTNRGAQLKHTASNSQGMSSAETLRTLQEAHKYLDTQKGQRSRVSVLPKDISSFETQRIARIFSSQLTSVTKLS